jgi:hypothetical protein
MRRTRARRRDVLHTHDDATARTRTLLHAARHRQLTPAGPRAGPQDPYALVRCGDVELATSAHLGASRARAHTQKQRKTKTLRVLHALHVRAASAA